IRSISLRSLGVTNCDRATGKRPILRECCIVPACDPRPSRKWKRASRRRFENETSDRLIGVDTNVLVRWLTADDATAYKRVVRLVADSGDDGLYLSDTVLVELVWVLTRTYRLGRMEALETLEALL